MKIEIEIPDGLGEWKLQQMDVQSGIAYRFVARGVSAWGETPQLAVDGLARTINLTPPPHEIQ